MLRSKKSKVLFLFFVALLAVVSVCPYAVASVAGDEMASEFGSLIVGAAISEPDLVPSGKGIAGNPRVVYTMEQFIEAMGEGSYSHVMLSDAGVTGEDSFIDHKLTGEHISISSSPGVKVLYIKGRHRISSYTDYVLPFITVSGNDLVIEGDDSSALVYDCKAAPSSAHTMFSVPGGDALTIRGDISLAVYSYDYAGMECSYESSVVTLGDGTFTVSGNPTLYGFCATETASYRSSAVVVGPTGGEFASSEVSMDISGGRFISLRRSFFDGEIYHDPSSYGIYTADKSGELMDICLTGGVFSGGIGNKAGTSEVSDYVLMGHRSYEYGDGLYVVTEEPFGFISASPSPGDAEISVYDNVPYICSFDLFKDVNSLTEMGFTRKVSIEIRDAETDSLIEQKYYSAKDQEDEIAFVIDSHDETKYTCGETYNLRVAMELYDRYNTFVTAKAYDYTVKVVAGVQLSDIEFTGVSVPIAGQQAQPPSFSVSANTDNYIISQMYWTDGNNNTFNGVFEKDKLYSAYVHIKPLSGEKIVPDEYLSVRVDEEYPVFYALNSTQDELVVVLCSYYAQETPRTDRIEQVHIEYLSGPEKGGSATDSVYYEFNPQADGFSVADEYWTTSDNSVFTGTFASDTEYKFYIVLRADDGSYFAPAGSMDITVNGEEPDYINVSSDEYGKNTLCYIMMRYVVDPPRYISTITITDVEKPVAGKSASVAPAYTITSDMSDYTAIQSYWMDSVRNLYFDEIAEGETYYTYLMVESNEGAKFVDDMTITVDGKSAVDYSFSSDNTVCRIVMTENVAQKPDYRHVTGIVKAAGDGQVKIAVVLTEKSTGTVVCDDELYGNTTSFAFADIEPGEYTITFTKEGFAPYTKDITVAGSDVFLNVIIGLEGDLTGDGLVNSTDLSKLLAAYGSNDSSCDIDGNGVVNSTDLSVLLANYGKSV